MQGSSRERMKVPADFMKALPKNEKAQTAFERLAPSHKKAYVEAIVEARKEEMRAQRIEQAVRMPEKRYK